MKTAVINPLGLKCVTTTCTPGVNYDSRTESFRLRFEYKKKNYSIGSYADIDTAIKNKEKALKLLRAGFNPIKVKQKKLERRKEKSRAELLKKGMIEINGFIDYFACRDGHIYSIKEGVVKRMYESLDAYGYLRVSLRKTNKCYTKKVHILIGNIFHTGDGVLNHKKGIKTDNRASQLERVTQAQNVRHSVEILKNIRGVYMGAKSGYVGVVVRENKLSTTYQAKIGIGGKIENLGTFDTAEEASAVYQARLRGSWDENRVYAEEMTC